METQQIIQVDPESIVRPKQVRTQFDDAAIAELVQSIRAVGILQPVLVRRDGKQLIALDGERRIRAAIALSLRTIPAIVTDKPLDGPGIIELQLIANCVRTDLTAMEQATAIEQLIEQSKCTAADVAARLGKSPATISKFLALRKAPQHVRELLEKEPIGIKAAYDIVCGATPVPSSPATSPAAPTTTASATKTPHRSKQTIMLDKDRSVVFYGVDSTMEDIDGALDEAKRYVRAARRQKIEFPTFAAMRRDQVTA